MIKNQKVIKFNQFNRDKIRNKKKMLNKYIKKNPKMKLKKIKIDN